MAEHKDIHATIGLGPNASEFRGKPNPEVDTAWDRVKRTYLYPMTKEEVFKMGNDPECVVLMPEDLEKVIMPDPRTLSRISTA